MIDFKILTACTTYELSEKIKEFLNEGWELYGNMSAVEREVNGNYSKTKEHMFYQSMILKETKG